MTNQQRTGDAVPAFRFLVELDGLLVGGFSEVTGVQSEIEVMEYAEGGLNDYVHYLPKRIKYPRIVLKRGIALSGELWEWYEAVAGGTMQRKNGAVILYGYDGKETYRWNFFEAYPVKWNGPELHAADSRVAVESIELVHSGLKMIKSK